MSSSKIVRLSSALVSPTKTSYCKTVVGLGNKASKGTKSVCLLGLLMLSSCERAPKGSVGTPTQLAKTPSAQRAIEGYPADVVAAFVSHQKTFTPVLNTARFQSIVSISRRSTPGSTITVAFLGGSSALRANIMEAIKPWLDVANIHFDFGPQTAQGVFREWSATDRSYAAQIRIAFKSGDDGGDWSLVGTDSINPAVASPNRPSMNFEGFDNALPPDWRATVLHEFGHALGFEHEHQSPAAPCDKEFRWDNDPGYIVTHDMYGQAIPDVQGRRPGIYTVLEAPPNKWTKDQIDFNLRQFASQADYILTSFDKASIMKYQFPYWMFVSGKSSVCYSEENIVLSPGDIEAAKNEYPSSQPAIAQINLSRENALQKLIRSSSPNSELKAFYADSSALLKRSQ